MGLRCGHGRGVVGALIFVSMLVSCGDDDSVSTPATTASPTATTVPSVTTDAETPATTQPAAPPTKAAPNKRNVEREVHTHIDQMNIWFDRCIEQPGNCDPEFEITRFAAPSSRGGASLVEMLDWAQRQITYAVDGDVTIRVLESSKVDENLNAATIVFCEINPVVLVQDVGGGQEIVSSEVARSRIMYRVLRLADGGWVIGPSKREGGLVEGQVPQCERIHLEGDASPTLLPENAPDEETDSGSVALTPPDVAAKAETEVRNRLKVMHDDLDTCFEAPKKCNARKKIRKYSLIDTEIAQWYPRTVSALAEGNYFYKDAGAIKRTIEDTSVGDAASTVQVVECYTDDAVILAPKKGKNVPLERSPQRFIRTYDWANLQGRGWTIVSASQKPLDDKQNEGRVCSA